jgi:hypothetical protein
MTIMRGERDKRFTASCHVPGDDVRDARAEVPALLDAIQLGYNKLLRTAHRQPQRIGISVGVCSVA